MQLTHDFTVPADIDRAWEVLLDIERIAPCMPGAAIESVDGDDFTGTVKVRLGPIGLTYRGKASFVEKDAASHRAVIDAQGKDARGNGTAKAIITATLTAQDGGTAVNVVTDLNITGKPAQFGRGVMVDVGNKLIGQFADCLAGKLTGSDLETAGVAAAAEPSRASDASGASGASGTAETSGASGTAETAVASDVEALADADADTVTQLDAVKQLDIDERLGTVDVESVPPAGVTVDELAAAGGDAAGEAVVALPGAASDEHAVEPAAAAEAAPPAQRLDDSGAASTGTPAQPVPGPLLAQSPPHRPAVADVEPIDLLGSAGPAVAKRLAPVAAGGVLLALLFLLRRRRRSASRSAERQAAAEYWAAVQRWAAAEKHLAAQRRDSVKQRQLDRRVLRLAGVLGQLAEPAHGRPAVLGRRPDRSRPAAGRGRASE